MKHPVLPRRLPRFVITFLVLMMCICVPAAAAPKLKKTKLTLKKGNVYVLRLTGNSKGASVTWSTSVKKRVPIISESHNRVVLRAKRTGKSVITAKIGSRTLKCTVTVKKNAAYPSTLTLCKGDKFTFTRTKKAKWSLSSAKKGTLSATSGKSVTFTAKKTGTVKLIATRGKKTYPCTIKILRKDGATKADLAEEKAIEEKKAADKDGSGSGTDSGSEGSAADSGSSSDTALEEWQKGMLASLAQSAARQQLGTEELVPCNIHSMDLSNEAMAFLLYQYVYLYAGAQDTEADLSIVETQGYVKTISINALQSLMQHLFGEVYLSDAMALFLNKYPDRTEGASAIFECVGDFGDAGLSYFRSPDTVTRSYDMFCLEGRVMVWNEAMQSYIHRYNYKAYWYLRTKERTVQLKGTDVWFQFDHVEIA